MLRNGIILIDEIMSNTKEEPIMDERTRKLIEDGQPVSIVHFDKDGKVTSEEKHNMENVSLSECQIEQLAKALLKPCMDFYSDPANVRRYEEWKAKREQE